MVNVKLSFCTIAYNEHDFINDMLSSIINVVDEIIIGIDNRTWDDTDAIAHRYGARTVPFTWTDDSSYARNIILDYATFDWILSIDADERLTPEGTAAIRNIF